MTQKKSPILMTGFAISIFFIQGCTDRPAIVQPNLSDEQIQQIMDQEKGARQPAVKGQPTGEASKNVPDLGL